MDSQAAYKRACRMLETLEKEQRKLASRITPDGDIWYKPRVSEMKIRALEADIACMRQHVAKLERTV